MSESQHKADDLHPTVETVLNTVDFDGLVDELEGRSGFRVSKPDANGLTQYVWRHARFHGGYDTSIPVTASWWLQEYLDDHGIDASVSGVMDEAGKALTDALEQVVDLVLTHFNESTMAAARRWDGLIA